MPYINVSLFPGQTKEKKKAIAEKITKVINEELPKVPDQNIWVTFSEIEADEWAIGDKDAKTAKELRDRDMKALSMEMAGVQMRRILGDTGKLKQIYKTRTSGAANGAKDWLREMVLLDDEQALRRDVAHYERKKREEYERTHRKDEADARDDEARYTKVYDELDMEGFMAEMSNLKDKIRDEDTGVFYNETRSKLSGWFGEDDYIVWRYDNWYKNNPYADNADLYDFVRDLLEDLDNYPGNRDRK